MNAMLEDPQTERDTIHFRREECLDKTTIREISRVTWVGVGVNVLLAAIKTAAGVAAASSVLLADAVHTLSDLATDAAVLIGVRFWCAPADAKHPHGHRKIETLVTLAIGIALILIGAGMGYEAVKRLVDAVGNGRTAGDIRAFDLVSAAALSAALISLIGKELLYRWTVRKGITLGSSAVVANAWHHRSDALSSIPAALAIGGTALGAHSGYDLWFLDPVGTLVVCVMLLQAAWEVAAPTLAALVDASADRQLCSAIRRTILTTEGVLGTYMVRTRVIGSRAVEVDLQITVDRELTVSEGHDIAMAVKRRLMALRVEGAESRVVDAIVHVEPGDPVLERIRMNTADTAVDWKPHD